MKKHNRPTSDEIDRRIALASMNEKILNDITHQANELNMRLTLLKNEIDKLVSGIKVDS